MMHQISCRLAATRSFLFIMRHKTLLVLLAALATAQGSCPHGFHKVGNQCYHFSQESIDTKTWDNARSYCQMLDSELAQLGLDCNADHHLISYINSQGYTDMWIGATDTAFEGKWMWIDGRPVDMMSSLWYYSKPVNPSASDCAFIDKISSSYLRSYMYDASCSLKKNYVCQTDYDSKLGKRQMRLHR